MVIIQFPNPDEKLKALGFLPGRFAFKSWTTGEMLVPEVALPFLAIEGIAFTVEGPATYERHVSAFRNPPATGLIQLK